MKPDAISNRTALEAIEDAQREPLDDDLSEQAAACEDDD